MFGMQVWSNIFVLMLLSLSADLTKMILMILFSMYSVTNLKCMSTCMEHPLVVIILVMKIAPTLSTQIIIGHLTLIFMLCNRWSTNMSFSTASDAATYSASELDNATLCWALDLQLIGTPQTQSTKPEMIVLLSGSPAWSLPLKQTNSHGFHFLE